jgi:hypothetical protein
MKFRTLVLSLVSFLVACVGTHGETPAELTDRQRSVLEGVARDRYTGRWTDLSTNQLADMRLRAEAYLTDLRRYHRPNGLIVSARFADTNRSSVVQYEAVEDSSAWTAFALAAHAFRYVITRDTNAFTDIRVSLQGIDRLLQVSGKPGYLARFAGAAKDPAYQPTYSRWGGPDPERPGFGKLAFTGASTHSDLVWLSGPSRDHYAAVNFGLMTVFQLVRDQAIRSQISNSVTLIIDRLERDGWRIDDGHGNRTFLTPLLHTALLRSAATINPGRFRKEFETKAGEFLKMPPPPVLQYSDYAPNVFNMASLNVLSKLEISEPSRKLLFQERLTEMMRLSESHLNPFLGGCYVEGFERVPNSTALTVTFQGVLYDFPWPPRWAKPVDLTQDASLPTLEANGTKWSKLAVPFRERPPAPFQWAASPFLLQGGQGSLVAHPGVDYLLAFWIGRDALLIPSEDYTPLQSGVRKTPPPISTNTTAKRPTSAK